jgi:hypothetical protein
VGVIDSETVALVVPKNPTNRVGWMLSARVAGSLRKAPTVIVGTTVSASVGSAVYIGVIDTVGVITNDRDV